MYCIVSPASVSVEVADQRFDIFYLVKISSSRTTVGSGSGSGEDEQSEEEKVH